MEHVSGEVEIESPAPKEEEGESPLGSFTKQFENFVSSATPEQIAYMKKCLEEKSEPVEESEFSVEDMPQD